MNDPQDTPVPATQMRLSCEFSMMNALVSIIVWVILSLVTFGLAAFFAVYYFTKAIINETWLVNAAGEKVGRYSCNLTLGEIIGHIIIWIILTVITFGIASIFYFFMMLRLCFNRTTIVAP